MNAALLSFVLLSSTGFEMAGLHLWQDVSELLCGLWIAASPFVWGYANAGPVRCWHFVLGGALVFLGSFSLWKGAH
jgi:SPW repeat